jgi:ADP-heptose:LPS heptosyltransferase
MTPCTQATRSVRRVLVIFPGALGDLMCLMPALAAISRRHPGASVELMARFELARFVAGRSVVARAHSIDAREVGELFADQTSGDARRFFRDFDRIYSFFASDDARFRERLAATNDAQVSFNPFRPGGEGHVSEGYLRAIGERPSMLDARIEPTSDDLAAARVLLESKCDVSNLIVIFPGSGSPAKNWPANRFAALASMLTKRSGILPIRLRSGLRLADADPALNDTRRPRAGPPAPLAATSDDARHSAVVVLGPAEASIEPVFREAGVPVIKDLELATVAAIASIASAFVANDSGVAHLAAAVGASGVVIFGPTDSVRWRPNGSGQIDILRREPISSVETREVAGALLKFVERRQR